MGPVIRSIDAWGVVNSRARPTVRVSVNNRGTCSLAWAPQPTETGQEKTDTTIEGRTEAVQGLVGAVRNDIAPRLRGHALLDQSGIDATLADYVAETDSPSDCRSPTLAVSGAAARAGARTLNRPLSSYLSTPGESRIPVPIITVFGGTEGPEGTEVQHLGIVPSGAESVRDAVNTGIRVVRSVEDRLEARGQSVVTDEDGSIVSSMPMSETLICLVAAIQDAGLRAAADDVGFYMDVAATTLFDADTDRYGRSSTGDTVTAAEFLPTLVSWVTDYPFVAVEDPTPAGPTWKPFRERTPPRTSLIGDRCLEPDQLRAPAGTAAEHVDGAVVKPDRSPTITAVSSLLAAARSNDIATILAARAGDVTDSVLAPLAVGTGVPAIKIGGLARGERVVKYNRLLGIEHTRDLPYASTLPQQP